jgi:hypothetical protein
MFLPFLKEKKWPRIAKPMEEKSYGLSSEDYLEDFCIEELMDAVEHKHVGQFRKALEVLILNCFEEEEEEHAG